PLKEIDREIERYRQALAFSCEDVEKLRTVSLKDGPSEIALILSTHLEMMKDPMLTTAIEDKIRNLQCNTESVFQHLIEEYKRRFNHLQDSYFQERVRDVIDVCKRILNHLCPMQRLKISELPNN